MGALLFGRKAESYWATVWQKRMRMVAVLPRSILPHLTKAALLSGGPLDRQESLLLLFLQPLGQLGQV